jgi:hypothetical protein
MLGLISRTKMVVQMVHELRRERSSPRNDDPADGTVFILDGVGGIMLVPLCVRRGLWDAGLPGSIEIYDWHSGPRGELLGDLIAYRRNLRKAAVFAEVLTERRRRYPDAPLHVVAFSGGSGLATFAIEQLPADVLLDVVVLGCSALSPRYRLTGMLRHVRICVALVSSRDRYLIGLGTTLFGTMDRRFGPGAGLRGFRRPTPFGDEDAQAYDKLHQLPWRPHMRSLGHYGHHVGCATSAFIAQYMAPILLNQCDAPMHHGPFDANATL